MKWRRYRTADGATWTTYEVPASVITYIGPNALRYALAAAEKRLAALNRLARIKVALIDGTKPTAIAHAEGVTDAYVRQIRSKMQP